MRNRTLKIDNEYSIKIRVDKQADSNYRQFVSIHRKDEKQPLLGLSFKDTDNNKVIKETMILKLKKYLNPWDSNLLTSLNK